MSSALPVTVDPQVDRESRTRDRVARAILENGASTAADLADLLGLTPAAVRRHLDAMVVEGDLEPQDQRVYGQRGRGRPAKVFALTEEGRARFDQQYDDLATQALRFLAETGGSEAVQQFARRRAEFIKPAYAAITDAEPQLTPAQALARVFSKEGYAASVKQLPIVGDQLCQQHCPVSHVAHEFPELCEAETQVIAEVLGTHVQRLATIAHGDGVCTTCIPHSPELAPEPAPEPAPEAAPHTRSKEKP